MELKDALEAVGLLIPVSLALITSRFFVLLDRNLSAQATRAVSQWLKGETYRRMDVRLAIISAFDRLYTSPLLRPKALFRSALASCIAFIVYFAYKSYVTWPAFEVLPINIFLSLDTANLMIATVLSDFLSLFAVRKFLVTAGNHLITSLFLGMLVGFVTVIVSFVVVCWIGVLIIVGWKSQPFIIEYFSYLPRVMITHPQSLLFPPALLVHLWLPLFALGALGVRLLYFVFGAVGWFQWFIKGGEQHPLRAVGWVAAVLVFAGAALGKLLAAIA